MARSKSTRPGRDRGFLLQDRIDTERRRLQRASAVLGCHVFAVNHDADDIDPGDAASVARTLIDDAVSALDSVVLERGTGDDDE